jgi:hypothetical protein
MEKFYVWAISALVEPIAAVLGAFAVTFFTPILPYALAFAAGAMICGGRSNQRRNRIIIRTSPTMGFVGIYCYDGLGCCSG